MSVMLIHLVGLIYGQGNTFTNRFNYNVCRILDMANPIRTQIIGSGETLEKFKTNIPRVKIVTKSNQESNTIKYICKTRSIKFRNGIRTRQIFKNSIRQNLRFSETRTLFIYVSNDIDFEFSTNINVSSGNVISCNKRFYKEYI